MLERERFNRCHSCEANTRELFTWEQSFLPTFHSSPSKSPLPLLSLVGIFLMQEAPRGKPAAASPDSCDHVLWFPQASARASWLLLALLLSVGKLCVGEILSWAHGACATAGFFLPRTPASVRVCMRGGSETAWKHREEARLWLASHPILKSQSQGLKGQRDSGDRSGFVWFPPRWGSLRPYPPSSKRPRPTEQGKACLWIFSSSQK